MKIVLRHETDVRDVQRTFFLSLHNACMKESAFISGQQRRMQIHAQEKEPVTAVIAGDFL